MNYNKPIIYLILLLFFTSSCKKSDKDTAEDSTPQTPAISFKVDNRNLDLNYIKNGCNIVNLANDQIPDNFNYINFFHTYLKFKSYEPNYVKYFDCREKLEDQAYYLLALDREPLNKVDYKSDINPLTFHREIIRNLYKIINVTRNGDGEYIGLSGISNGKLFEGADQNLIKQISDSKSYLKFYSTLDDKSGNYRDFYIPIKNYLLIKEYVLALNKADQKERGGGCEFCNTILSYDSLTFQGSHG